MLFALDCIAQYAPSQVSPNAKTPDEPANSAAVYIAVVEKLSVAEYDKLSPEEQKAHDKAMADQEAAEQAGVLNTTRFQGHWKLIDYLQIAIALPYRWKQTLQDVTVTVPVPQGTRSRDLIVDIKKTKLKVGLKGKEPIIDDELCKEVKVDDSTWTLGSSFATMLDILRCARQAGINVLTTITNCMLTQMTKKRLASVSRRRIKQPGGRM